MTEKIIKNGNNQSPTEKGIAIAKLTNKTTFWILEISIGKILTEMYFELTSNEQPLFVFSNRNKNRFAYTLTVNMKNIMEMVKIIYMPKIEGNYPITKEF